jgi:GNAT superfamily N-acetyltransferase
VSRQFYGLGFVQLFPSFSSVRAAAIFVLNDLFVLPSARRIGVGAQLLRAAAEKARSTRSSSAEAIDRDYEPARTTAL